MAICANVWLTHDLDRFDDTAATLLRLRLSLPAGLALWAFWRDQQDNDPGPLGALTWELLDADPRAPNQRSYAGPGLLRLDLTPALARIRTAARWQGFLTQMDLRQRHLEAFTAIADGLNSPKYAICAESADMNELLLGGATQQQCIDHLRRKLGDPSGGYFGIRRNIGVAAARKIWFLEQL